MIKPADYYENEISWIEHEGMRDFSIKYLNDFPDYFMVKPASSTGKYHNPWSNTIGSDDVAGGLAKHVKAMCYVVHSLATSEMLSSEEHDAALIATLGHDAIKYGFEGGDFCTYTHESEGAAFFRQCLQKYNAPIPYADAICRAIEFHQGRWAEAELAKIFPEDFDKIGQIVHRADMVASMPMVKFSFFD